MSKNTVLLSGILGLLSVGCDDRGPLSTPIPLPGPGTGGSAVVGSGGSGSGIHDGAPGGAGGTVAVGSGGISGGTGGATVVPAGSGGSVAAGSLAGIWSGNVKIDHPDFAGPPIDQMTIEIGDDGKIKYCGFTQFGYQATFGTPPAALPLTGSAIAHVVGDGFLLRFTVQTADWQADHLAFTYTEHSDGLGTGETPQTPYTDLIIALTGTLVDGKLRVHWTDQGNQYTAPLQAVADGDLSR